MRVRLRGGRLLRLRRPRRAGASAPRRARSCRRASAASFSSRSRSLASSCCSCSAVCCCGMARRLRQRGGIECEAGRRPRRAGVGAGEPVADVEQLAHGDERVVVRDRRDGCARPVAERDDHPRLVEYRLAGCLLECRLVDQRRQVVLVRELERRVVLEEPSSSRARALVARRSMRCAGRSARRFPP